MQLTLAKESFTVPLSLSKESVTLSIYKATYPADYAEGDRYETDISEVTIKRADCISSADFVRDVVQEFTSRGARFDYTGSDWAKTEPYQHPYSGEWEETSVHFQGEPDGDLQQMIVVLVDSGQYR